MASVPRSMWTYDLAREQSPSLEFLTRLARLTLDSGYDALGLYLEHRFAYPSAPWAAGSGSVTPDMVKELRREFPALQIIPFMNLLGHMEGFLYAEGGRHLAEERLKGLQACPSNPGTAELARKLVDDVLLAFEPEIIHLGGDETKQLGSCPACRSRIEASNGDGKGELFAAHFGPLVAHAAAQGARPALWADMVLTHPSVVPSFPKDTIWFDWQYFNDFSESSTALRVAGHTVVACPALHTYNATWLHLGHSLRNLEWAIRARDQGLAEGVCLTTWECALFGNYESLLPVLAECGHRLNARPVTRDDELFWKWATLMGQDLEALGGSFAMGKIRSSLKCRLLLYGNPFLAWLHHADELCGEVGDRALALAQEAEFVAPNASCRGVSSFLRHAIEFVRAAEAAHQAYARQEVGAACAALAPARQMFDALKSIAVATNLNAGGSLADMERCQIALRHIEVVLQRIQQYGDGSLGYLPAWEVLTHPRFVPHDQECWWIVNQWANE